ncbi:MAG TPA: TM0106 family RecB-like putative nuclease, partial [Acidimicrobiales bacterium]|nr:TM0106 family RecB-like putative nuclease [Acidimicrobiales bacterium]
RVRVLRGDDVEVDVDECRRCRWRAWCGAVLEETADLSLISGVGPARRRLYQAHGVGDLHALAALDWTTAELVRCRVDLTDLLDRAEGLPPATSLAAVIPNRAVQRERLAAHGLRTVADTDAIERRTLDLCSAGASNLATQIDLARARVGPAPAYRRRGVDRVRVLRGDDVEVDVDMENAQGCYLWGALVTDRRRSPPTSRYVPFATWDRDLDRGELVAFGGFWGWLTGERARARADGATFRAYCYSKSAEEGQMKRIADRLGWRGEVDELLSSDDWVDLHHVVRTQLVTGRSMGLKQTAPLAGFTWRSDDVGGDLALVQYGHAVDDTDPDGQQAARRWILEYNEDDVRATAALRQWLDTEANELPSIADAQRGAAAGPDRGPRRRPSWYGR